MTDEYATTANVKAKALVTGSAHDDEILGIIAEASRFIDNKLRPYISPNKHTLILKEADYVNCASTDVGKPVRDDDVEVGILHEYNNETRTWIIWCDSSVTKIAVESEVEVYGGYGSGVASADSTRPAEDDEPFVFYQVPLTSDKIPDIITQICENYSVAWFLQRQMPKESYADTWQGLADKMLEDFITQNFKKGIIKFV